MSIQANALTQPGIAGASEVIHLEKPVRDNSMRLYQMMLGMQAKQKAQEDKDFARRESMIKELDKFHKDTWPVDLTDISDKVKAHMTKAAELLDIKTDTPDYIKKQIEGEYDKRDINELIDKHNNQHQEYLFLIKALGNESFNRDYDTVKLNKDLQDWLKTPLEDRKSMVENLENYKKPYEFNAVNILDKSPFFGKEQTNDFTDKEHNRFYQEKWNMLSSHYFNKGHDKDGNIVPGSEYERDLKAYVNPLLVQTGEQYDQLDPKTRMGYEKDMMNDLTRVAKARFHPQKDTGTTTSDKYYTNVSGGKSKKSTYLADGDQRETTIQTYDETFREPLRKNIDTNADEGGSIKPQPVEIVYQQGLKKSFPSIKIPSTDGKTEKSYDIDYFFIRKDNVKDPKIQLKETTTTYDEGGKKQTGIGAKVVNLRDYKSKIDADTYNELMNKSDELSGNKSTQQPAQQTKKTDIKKPIDINTLTKKDLPSLQDGQIITINGEQRKWNKKLQKAEIIK